MKTPKRLTVAIIIAGIIGSLNGYSESKAGPGSADLKQLFEQIHKSVTSGDEAKADKLLQALLPDEARLRRAFSDSANPETVQKIVAFHRELAKGPHEASLLAKPGQSVVRVDAATTEDLTKYARGSVAYAKFPGGARDLAQQGILRPGLTFYEVEFLEPGKDAGMQYHLFYWDGSAWTMLGPVWRALQ
jgi:hypothetical protein